MSARRILAAAALALCSLLADGAAAPRRAACAICNTAPCYNSSTCFRGCACLKQGTDPRGTCVSFDAIPPGAAILE